MEAGVETNERAMKIYARGELDVRACASKSNAYAYALPCPAAVGADDDGAGAVECDEVVESVIDFTRDEPEYEGELHWECRIRHRNRRRSNAKHTLRYGS